jgi:diguanylate cyclase (GGDEF)-like protein
MRFAFDTLRARLIGSSALAMIVLLVVCSEFLRAFSHQAEVVEQIKEQQITRLQRVGRLLVALSDNQVQLSDLLASAIERKLDEEAVFDRGRKAIDTVRALDKQYRELLPSFQNDDEALSVYRAAERELAVYRTAVFSVVDLCTVDIKLAPVEMLKAGGSYVRITDDMNNVVKLTNARVASELGKMQAGTERASRYLLASGGASLLVLIFGSALFYRDMRRAEIARDRGKEEIHHLAHHDTLTGLPNRVLFAIELKRALARAKRGEKAALLYLDLDHFKRVNDTLGHSVGDELLRQAADRLRGCVRETDVIARLGGDEFAILQTPVADAGDAATLARRVEQALQPVFALGNSEAAIGVSIGIATAPDDATDQEQLVKSADLALYAAKASGRGSYHFYKEELDARMKARHQVEADLRVALAEQQFELHYQPIVDLRSGEVKCCEALLRWHHPTRGTVPPAEFIPVAEDCGLIGQLGHWALRQACLTAAGWPGRIAVAVNLSSAQVKAETLVLQVTAALAASGLAPDRLELEVTESVLMQDTVETLATLHHLRELGVRIAMDDFGTGYSSLSYLRTFPFDKIKIDKSFIDHIANKEDCVTIVQAVTTMAQRLSMTTVAEGVETDDQRQKLSELGCTEMQGYLFSRPQPVGELMRMLQASSRAVSAA